MSRPARALIVGGVAIAAVVLLAAVLAAPVHEALLDWGWLERPASDYDYDRGFLKVFRKLLLLPLAALFLVVARPWRDGFLRPYGLVPPRARARPALVAFPVTVAVLLAVLGAHLLAGWMRWEDPPRWEAFQERLVARGLGGIVIACVEEWFFRGWLLHRLARRLVLWKAAVVSAVVYGFAHAFKPSNLTVSVSHDAAGALEALRGWLAYALDPAAFGPPFLGLCLFGLLLTALYLRTRTLWTSIAVHAAAVWILFSHGALTQHVPERTWAGSKWLYDGPPVWVLLAVATWWFWPRPAAALPGAGEDSSAPSETRAG